MLVSILTIFKDKRVQSVILGFAVYYFIKLQFNAVRRKNLLADIENEAGQFALRLHDAFHPFIEPANTWLELLPDGTDEAAVYKIAKEMNAVKNFKKVANAYSILYNQDLAKVLSSEGVFDEFIRIYEGRPVSKVENVESYGVFKVGDTVTVKLGHSIRDAGTLKTVKLGNSKTEFGIFTILINQNIAGIKKGVWANVYATNQANGGAYYMVHIDSLKKA